MKARKVFEIHPYEQGYTETKFGFEINSRVFWVGIYEAMSEEAYKKAQQEEQFCDEVVKRWNEYEGEDKP